MKTFHYRALNSEGRAAAGTVAARDETAASSILSEQKLVPFEIVEAAHGPAGAAPNRRRAVSSNRRAVLDAFHQLAALLKAGLPLLDAIRILREGATSSGIGLQFEKLEREMRGGAMFPLALSNNFPNLAAYVPRYVELGMQTGKLGNTLSDAIDRMVFEDSVRRDIAQALAYPIFLLGAGLSVALFLFTSVLPNFASMVQGDEDHVPGFSRALIGAGIWLRDNYILTLVIVAVFGAVIVAVLRSPAARARSLDFLSRTPLLGDAIRLAEWATWSRIVGGALGYGAHLTVALEIGVPAMRLASMRDGLIRASRRIRSGEILEDALRTEAGADEFVVNMVKTGRLTGRLSEMLLFVSERYESDTKARLKQLTALAEPVAILLVGGLIAIVVLAVVLTISSVYEGIN